MSQEKQLQPRGTLPVPEALEAAAQTFRERNAVYGSNYEMVGPIMGILFPNGVDRQLLSSDQFHLFELVIVKLSRLAVSGLTHVDSAHDAAVYCAMIEAAIKENDLCAMIDAIAKENGL